jgi:hypothetical protein
MILWAEFSTGVALLLICCRVISQNDADTEETLGKMKLVREVVSCLPIPYSEEEEEFRHKKLYVLLRLM